MQRIKRQLLCVIMLAALSVTTAAYADPVLSIALIPPGGAVSAAPGTTVGWGFTLTNSGDQFAVITSADFCGSVVTSPCSTGLGTFTDFIAQFNFTVIDPLASVTAAFDLINLTGIGSYQIDSGAAIGDSFAGQLVLTYDLFGDLSDPFNSLVSSDNRLSTAASVFVAGSGGPAAPVPEPGTLLLLSSGLAGFYVFRRCRQS